MEKPICANSAQVADNGGNTFYYLLETQKHRYICFAIDEVGGGKTGAVGVSGCDVSCFDG